MNVETVLDLAAETVGWEKERLAPGSGYPGAVARLVERQAKLAEVSHVGPYGVAMSILSQRGH